jgi:hypothetical protein
MKIQGKEKPQLQVICTTRLKSEPEIEILAIHAPKRRSDQSQFAPGYTSKVLENARKKKLTTKQV